METRDSVSYEAKRIGNTSWELSSQLQFQTMRQQQESLLGVPVLGWVCEGGLSGPLFLNQLYFVSIYLEEGTQ